ncbi:major facilitator superfamily domain-containing protein [Ochromonadaceae sp. CCMP2298]|nr:major facilitator superfamily domain-containing protein [Ochromonadaceae sp. CCMP2298]|mmetsp:Transcript_11633/g.25927  ORF Transcript_11633/g.25927 Transcript_11633/m.25927 type:complete len:650 (+) Transcript_11633:56-2005(+)
MEAPLRANSVLQAESRSLILLFFISFVYFLENFDRYFIAVSPIPYIDYASYEYSILAGPAFTMVYTIGGVIIALSYGEALQGTGYCLSKFNILAAATLLFSVVFASTSVAKRFWQQVVIRVVMGLAQSIITPFSTSIISDHFAPVMLGSAFGIFNSGTYFAFSLSLSLGTYMYTEYGWQAGYVIFGLAGAVCACLMPLISCLQGDSMGSAAAEGFEHTEDVLGGAFDLADDSCHGDSGHGDGDGDASGSDTAYSAVRTGDGIIRPVRKSLRVRLASMLSVVHDIVCVQWRKPGIYTMLLATGVRLGGGYVWASYTSVFFSTLFVTEDDSSCSYSYSSAYDQAPSMCGDAYPYCVDGECSKLSTYPWHNEGMDSLKLIEYMSWVPVVGSAFGSLMGGFLSDLVILRMAKAKMGGSSRKYESLLNPVDAQKSPLWRAEPESETDGATFSSGGPGGSVGSPPVFLSGADMGNAGNGTEGNVGDADKGEVEVDQSPRMLIAGLSNILALPLILASLMLGFPYCFLILVVSGMVGELYLGQTLALISDRSNTRPVQLTQAVALFMFIITIIGGNVPVLIPFVAGVVGGREVQVDFEASSQYAPQQEPSPATYSVSHRDPKELQVSLMVVLGACYGLSGLLYLLSYSQLKAAGKD